MAEIIQFPEDLKETSYFGEGEKLLGVTTKDKALQVERLDPNTFAVNFLTQPDINICQQKIFTRQELAEFLYVASVFIDSEGRWAPDVDLVGADYE